MEALKHLIKVTKEVGGTTGHMTVGEPYKEKDVIGVISVYIGERPAHKILEDLTEHAMNTNNVVLVDLIERFSDMSLDDEEQDEE